MRVTHGTNTMYIYVHTHSCAYIYVQTRTHVHAREIMRERERDARAVSHVRRSHALSRCSCNCVCRLGMLEVVWRRLSGRTRCLVPLFSTSVSLASFRSLSLCLSLPTFRSPFPSCVPLPRIVRFPFSLSLFLSFSLFLQLVSSICSPCSGLLSIHFSLFEIPAGSFHLTSRGEPLIIHPRSLLETRHDCIFNLGRLSFSTAFWHFCYLLLLTFDPLWQASDSYFLLPLENVILSLLPLISPLFFPIHRLYSIRVPDEIQSSL